MSTKHYKYLYKEFNTASSAVRMWSSFFSWWLISVDFTEFLLKQMQLVVKHRLLLTLTVDVSFLKSNPNYFLLLISGRSSGVRLWFKHREHNNIKHLSQTDSYFVELRQWTCFLIQCVLWFLCFQVQYVNVLLFLFNIWQHTHPWDFTCHGSEVTSAVPHCYQPYWHHLRPQWISILLNERLNLCTTLTSSVSRS